MLGFLFGFSGRIGRPQFVMGFVLALLAGALSILARWNGLVMGAWIGGIAYLWIGASVTVKRLHDIGESGWAALILLVPILGPIIMALVGAITPPDFVGRSQ